MSVIIAATDFSPVANNAVFYACAMAAAYNRPLHIVHSYIIPVAYGDTPMPLMPVDDGRQIAEESMAALTTQLKTGHPGVAMETAITYGDITDSLQDYIAKITPWVIVVGNSSDEDTKFWLGSNLVTELKELACTVLAIPPAASFTPPANICLACDFKQIGKSFPAADIISLVQLTKAQLHVLNVDHDNKHFGTDLPLNAELIHQYLDPVNPRYHYIDNKDVEDGINSFVANQQMDWLMVIPHKHSFVESLFRKSHTNAIVRISQVPVVALHEDENK